MTKIYCPVDEKETNLKADGTCEQCDSDLTPLLRLKQLPQAYFEEALKLRDENRVEEAIEKLIVATNFNNGLWEAHFTLGKLYAHKGLFDDAISQFNKAMAISPERGEIVKAREETEIFKSQTQSLKEIQKRKLRTLKYILIIAPLLTLFIGLSIIPISTRFKKQEAIPHSQPLAKISVFQYTVKSKDCLEVIAYRFYGDKRMWGKIYEANKDKIVNPGNISIGLILNIPMQYK